MANGDVYVSFGADTTALNQALEEARRSTESFGAQMSEVARLMTDAGRAADVELGKGLQVAGARLGELDAHNRAFGQSVKGVDQSLRGMAAAHNIAAESMQHLHTTMAGIHESVTAGASALDKLHSALVRVAELAGVTLTFNALKSWVEQTAAAGDALDKEAARYGQSLEDIQQLHGIGKLAGTSDPDLVANLSKLQGELRKAKDDADETANAFAAVGLSFDQMKGKSPLQLLEALAGAFSRYADGAGKTAVANKLLSDSGIALIRFFDEGKNGFRELEDAVTRAGDTMSSSTIAALAKMEVDIRELKLAWNDAMFAGVVPAADGGIRAVTRLVEAIDANAIETAVERVGEAIIRILGQIADFAARAEFIWDKFGADFAKINAQMQPAADVLNKIVEWENHSGTAADNAAAEADGLHRAWSRVLDVVKSVPDALEETGAVTARYAEAWRRSIDANAFHEAATAAFGGLDASAVQLALRMQKIADVTDSAAAAFRRMMQTGTTAHSDAAMGGAAYYGTYPQHPGSPRGPQVPAIKTSDDDSSSGSDDAYSRASAAFQKEIIAAEEAAQEITVAQDGMLQRHSETMAQWLAATLRALDKEQDAIQDSADKAMATDGLTGAERQRLADQEDAHLKEIAKQILQAQNKAAEETQRAWDNAFNAINSAFDSQVDGLLRGTTSWGQAFKNVLATLIEDMTKFFLDWGLKATERFVEDQVMNTARVTSHVTGNATMAASDAAAASAGGFAWLAGAVKTIEADAASVFGSVFAFLAPAMGPGAAAPAAAASGSVLAGLGAVASADIGMWSVPRDQLALVHHRELIMPAAEAGAFRAMLSGAGGGAAGGGNVAISPTTHLHFSGLDAQGMAQFWRGNQREMMRAVDEAVRHGAHLGLRRLAG